MSSHPKTLLALALSVAAGPVAAQPRATDVMPAANPGGTAVNNVAPPMTSVMAPVVAPVLGAGVAPSAPVIDNVSGSGVPSAVAAPVSAAPVRTAPALTSGARSAAPFADSRSAAVPTAGAALDGAGRKLSQARLAGDASGGGFSVSRELFDAAAAKAGLRADVAARAQNVSGAVAQKVSIANSASPADAPRLYQDAIQTAKDGLPASAAEGEAKLVRSFAAQKAGISLGDLVASAYQAAAGGAASETGRLLSAFDQWESLLGAPGRPLIANESELKSDVSALLRKNAAAAGAASAPHVWFERKDGVYTAMLPGAGVARIPALAAVFAISRPALAPATALSDAYRAFASAPRASTGAGLVYRARLALGASVPSAFLSASRFWLRAAFESFWRRVAAFFRGGAAYELSRQAGRDALRRDAALAETSRGEAAAARRLLSDVRPNVAGTRAAFAALARSAAAYRTLTGEDDAAAAVEALRRSFEAAAAGLRPSDELPARLGELVTGPGAVAHWAERLEDEASRAVDGRFWRARDAAEFVNLGSADGPAVAAAAAAKAAAGSPLAVVALDDRFWARGRGANGEARLSAELRATASGGGVELFVERGDAGLARRLEDIGLTVFPEGAGLRAVVGPQDFAYGADELGALASRALAAALGREDRAGARDAGMRALADEIRGDRASAMELASRLDGREAFARAPLIDVFVEDGDPETLYEAVGPVSVSLGGKPLLVDAARGPDGLLKFAAAARPDGTPLGAADIRALLRAK